MIEALYFPLYLLGFAGGDRAAFKDFAGERHLPLFTSVENATRYRAAEAIDLPIMRINQPGRLRDILLAHREVEPDFKIVIDPMHVPVD